MENINIGFENEDTGDTIEFSTQPNGSIRINLFSKGEPNQEFFLKESDVPLIVGVLSDLQKNKEKELSSPLAWAKLLEGGERFAAFKPEDLVVLMRMKDSFEDDFARWCEEVAHAGPEDEMEKDLRWLGKAIRFFVERGYMKN